MTDINLHQELQTLNIKVAETTESIKALCRKFDAFMENGAPRCADQEARLNTLETFHDAFDTGNHAVCQAGKARWEDTEKNIKSLKAGQRWIAAGIISQAGLIVWKFIMG